MANSNRKTTRRSLKVPKGPEKPRRLTAAQREDLRILGEQTEALTVLLRDGGEKSDEFDMLTSIDADMGLLVEQEDALTSPLPATTVVTRLKDIQRQSTRLVTALDRFAEESQLFFLPELTFMRVIKAGMDGLLKSMREGRKGGAL